MKRNNRVSLKDVASSLGVSTALVSMVLNGKAKQYRIGDEMTKRVINAAKEMNYSPNLVAQNLRGGKTHLIGLIVTDISNPFYSMISRIVEDRAIELNYTVVFSSSDENLTNTKNLVDVLLNKGVDGLIIVPCDGSEKLIQELHESNIPIVLLDRYFPDIDVSFSCLNNFKSTVLATQHLINQGYNNISTIAYKTDMIHIRDRVAGYEDTMKKAGFEENINVKRVNILNPKIEIFRALDYFINKKKTDAVIFMTNMLSISGLYCLNELNVKIPDDLGVVGFNGNDVFDLFYSPITYVKQPVEQIAREAVNILVDKIMSNEYSKKSMVILDPELVIQKSSIKNTGIL